MEGQAGVGEDLLKRILERSREGDESHFTRGRNFLPSFFLFLPLSSLTGKQLEAG